ncbi:MAG: YicC/YloC family endoribonuclease [Phycisphaerales bacterium]|nr:YicC/YloC family endoribonuclease [Phycisphaerales bacterium]
MLRSMTGFGTASRRDDGMSCLVEIRSVNNRYLKPHVRLPDQLQGLEADIDAALSRRLTRGSVTVTVKYSDTSATAAATINTDALAAYMEQLGSIGASPIDPGNLLSLPGIVVSDTGIDLMERIGPVVMELVAEACDGVLAMRTREGAAVQEDIEQHLNRIEEHLGNVEARAPHIVDEYQKRLHQRMTALLSDVGKSVRDDDLLREVAVFAERADIAEEIARLKGHLQQFRDLLGDADGEPMGRTLDFLSQEMLREANTIASKCLDGEVSRRVVEIKGSIDRVKEQVQNVE